MPLPDVAPWGYLKEAFIEVGKVSSNGFGIAAVPWAEIHAYSEIVGTITPAEAVCLRQMSVAYCEGLALDDPLSAPPWGGE